MNAQNLPALTGIRFFAALWVVLFHFHAWLLMLLPALAPFDFFFQLGHQAVPLFFLLSGFILAHNHFFDYSLCQHPKFIFWRFARLWPVHVATLFLTVLGPDLFQLNKNLIGSLAEESLMVRSWFHGDLAWNYPAWSISAEWFAYIFVFPLAFLVCKRIRSLPALTVLVALLLTAQDIFPASYFPGRCGSIFFLFLAGCILNQMFRLVKNPPAEAITLSGVLLFLSYVFFGSQLHVVVLYSAFALLIFGLAYGRGWLARLLATKIVVQGGLVSYSLYLTHILVLRSYAFFFWERLPHSLFVRIAIFLLLFGSLIGTALLAYFFIEIPANRALRRWQAGLSGKIVEKKLP